MDRTSPVLTAIVNNALDDLDADRIDIPTVLRLVAERAWQEGYQNETSVNAPSTGYRGRCAAGQTF